MTQAGRYLRLLEDEIAQLESDASFIEIDDKVWCDYFKCVHFANRADECAGEVHSTLYIKKV